LSTAPALRGKEIYGKKICLATEKSLNKKLAEASYTSE